MNESARWQRLESLLDELLELAPEDRAVRLDQLSAGDAGLRPELERMLAADEDASSGPLDRGLGPLASAVMDDGEPAAAPGAQIGPYRVIREIGRGGMGEVLLGERTDGDFEQRVAIKVVRAGLDRGEIVERFRRERNMLARLQHPNIAALYDGGTTTDGVPWFAMEYVEGDRITDWCDARRLGVMERIELFEAVCRAVEYAHQRLVLHRDLKPGNVLVTEDGRPQLLDFGIGRLMDADPADETQPTRGFMTPAFAAPEQIRGETASTTSDVFSLGMLLYVLLTGHHPHGDTSRSVEVARAIVEDDAPVGSASVARDSATRSVADIAAARGTDPSSLQRRLRGDLDNILGKALRKQPDERYASARELREDLERYRASLPVRARAATTGYRLKKWAKRNRAGAVAAIVALVAVVAGVSGVVWQAGVARQQRDRAEAVKEFVLDVLAGGDPLDAAGEPMTVVELVQRGAERISGRLEEDPHVRAEISLVLGRVLASLGDYDRAEEILTRALTQHEALGDPMGAWEALRRLAHAKIERGEYDQGLVFADRARELARTEFGEDDWRTLLSRGLAGDAELGRGNIDRAGELLEPLLRDAERVLSGRPEDIATHRQSYANYLEQAGRGAEAAEQLERVVEILRQQEDSGVYVASALASLGSLQTTVLDEREKGAESLREAVEILRAEYGEVGHRSIGAALLNLGGAYHNLRRYDEAEITLREAIDMFSRTVGEENWLVGRGYTLLARTKGAQGDHVTRSALLDDALRVQKAALGPDHPGLASTLSNRGQCFLDQDALPEAEQAFQEAVDFSRRVIGPEHMHTAYPVAGLAGVRRRLGKLDSAEELYREAYEIRRKEMGESHSLTVKTAHWLGRVIAERGRAPDAAAILDGAVPGGREGLPTTADELADVLLERSRLPAWPGKDGPGREDLLQDALQLREQAFGPEDRRTAEIRDELTRLRGTP